MRRLLPLLALTLSACAGAPVEPEGPRAGSAPTAAPAATTKSPRVVVDTGVPRLGANGIGCLVRQDGTLVCWGETPWGTFDDPVLVPSAPSGLADIQPGQHMVDRSGIFALQRDGSWARFAEGAWQREPALQGIVRLEMGGFKRCGLDESGGVHCWASAPLVAKPVVDGAVDFAVGDGHACALSSGGEVSCWGPSAVPGVHLQFGEVAKVPGIRGAKRISAGQRSTCVVGETGKLLCWGHIGPGLAERAPFEVPGIDHAVAVAARWQTVCALEEDGGVKCYGDPYTDRPGAPLGAVAIRGMPPLARIAAGCGTTADESLYCWGSRTRARPAIVPDLDDVTAIAAGVSGTCALRAGGEVLCWGTFDRVPRAAREFGPAYAPTAIGVSDAAAIAMSEGPGQRYDLCWITRSAEVSCRGETGTVTPGVRGAAALAVGRNHACALRKDGEVWCWGGDDAPVFPGGPDRARKVGGLPPIAALDAGSFTTCAVDRRGEVWCWGPPLSEESIVAKEMSLSPHALGVSDADSVAVTSGYACARRRTGAVVCFGRNRSSILAPDPTDAKPVLGLTDLSVSGVKAVRSAGNFSCVIEGGGGVSCWGYPFPVTLGGRPHARHVPRGEIPGLSGVEDLVLGESHACALLRDRRVMCWGGTGGNVGNGSPSSGVRLKMP